MRLNSKIPQFVRLRPGFKNEKDLVFLRIRHRDPENVRLDQLFSGERLTLTRLAQLRFEFGGNGRFAPILPNDANWMITNEPLTEKAMRLPISSCVEFFNMSGLLTDVFGDEIPTYYLWNFLNVWDCFDEKRSRVRYSENDIGEKYISAVFEYAFDFSSSGISSLLANQSLFKVTNHQRWIFGGVEAVVALSELDLFEEEDNCT